MKAVVCREFSGPQGLAIEEAEPPKPGADEVRIAVHAASVNYIDLLIARGLYQIQPDLPYVAGAEGAGEVVETGADVTNVAPGDRVAVFHLTGAFAEEMVAKHWRTIPLPDGVSYDSGAATLHNYVTAAYALSRRGHLRDGETLVVHGATGGVGLAAV
jgi:NADPH2:quinone reductase